MVSHRRVARHSTCRRVFRRGPNLMPVIAFHAGLAWVAVILCGLVGLWGLALARSETTPRPFLIAVGLAVSVMLTQVTVGVVLLSTSPTSPGDQHTFYGAVIAATFTFAYVYRAQFRRRPALAYGLLLLFVMGLGIRGMTVFGVNF